MQLSRLGTREGKESGINLKLDCVKSFMGINDFRDFSTKYGFDSEIVASFYESFATHVVSLRRSGLNIILPLN